MAISQNIKDNIALLLVMGQMSLLGYKVSKLVMKHKMEKKLKEDIEWAEKQIDENTRRRGELEASISSMDLTETEKDAKLYRTAHLWQADIDRYTGYKWMSQNLLRYVKNITEV